MRRVSRRAFLRSSLAGGAGLAGAYLLGCGDDNGGAGMPAPPTLTEAPTPTEAPPNGVLGSTFTWEQLGPAGAQPAPRKDHSLVIRPAGAQAFLFGGRNDTGDLADFWVYDVASGTWAEADRDAPPARHGHNAAWDTVNDRMLVFGGQQGSSFFNDIWQYTPDDDRWAEIAPGGPLPAARYGAGGAISTEGVLDPVEPFLPNSFIITHGFAATGRFDDTWAFDITTDTWSQVTTDTEPPIPRCLMRAAWDPLRGRVIIFSGQSNAEPFVDDLWGLWDRGWVPLMREPRPTGRTFYSFVYDPLRHQIVLFGGDSELGPMNDVWLFHVQDEFWSPGEASNERPPARLGHDAVWLDHSSSMLVFGGEVGGATVNELWELHVTE